MDSESAKKTIASLLRKLAEGIDPFTGEILPDEHLLQRPQIARALLHAVQALDQTSSKAETKLPPNAGKPWTRNEEDGLISEFETGMSILDIAEKHGRTEGGITSRLLRLGKIERTQTSPLANGAKTENSPIADRNDENESPSSSANPPPKRHSGTWSKAERLYVTDAWCSPKSSHDELIIQSLSELTGRSPFAIIIRLYKESKITITEGDALCRNLATPKLLSEASVEPSDAEAIKGVPEKRKPNAALIKPMNLSPMLAAVLGAGPFRRTEVTKLMWIYIKQHGLQDKKDRRMINADEKLKLIFDGMEQVSMFEMTTMVSKHLK
ncbi:MAG: hypothetical protein JW384_01460 [Nitrosomonadaceae bacterium]|nr:hypothetical protein [Nitrosomonadaceae bacterium]